ncbi:hypothetical protein [Thermospira aquatica]|uniref:Uncharacterized protein n=1 Tax=Thermospira aquatica TaxID=2828656 RepID=A0AAX3BDA8_9SPIR|nr:hypothetical protein [Thermospira aquatica]URA10234.1 hypothetical protein KDW03_00040 [Thermospira aquatica]
MKLFWCDKARSHFLQASHGIGETLELFLREKRFFLIPEVLLQWIEDLVVASTSEIPHSSVVEMCRILNIPLTLEEEHFLRLMEKASRKEDAYRNFVDTLDGNPFLPTLIDKVHQAHLRIFSSLKG